MFAGNLRCLSRLGRRFASRFPCNFFHPFLEAVVARLTVSLTSVCLVVRPPSSRYFTLHGVSCFLVLLPFSRSREESTSVPETSSFHHKQLTPVHHQPASSPVYLSPSLGDSEWTGYRSLCFTENVCRRTAVLLQVTFERFLGCSAVSRRANHEQFLRTVRNSRKRPALSDPGTRTRCRPRGRSPSCFFREEGAFRSSFGRSNQIDT